MGIIAFLIFGLIAGALARFVVPGRDPMGVIATMLLGVVGALLGGFLFGGPDDKVGYLGAVVGAVIVLLLYKLVTRNSRTA
ncbi:MAG: GlsB/YeaQ/YmgE family stress response membrane protein [Actinobacteria bacterium]|nr:GlsB/YeaQ/YmgE family stress response membrane protein [Actinomycetota bacterium]MBW3651749.1 GlsB/YeaQ/YmgE family stress response membrane protein [Actinomycetota bacterium]